jgi:BirA family transcriptional regulator, biotin operon repressor / biotin---[acetyl-CoA-carboxylase] ligase
VTEKAFYARREHFARVGSTNDVISGWLADGEPEVCIATADEQWAGRGREGRTWLAPAGTGLLLSLGFRPAWLPPDRVWQLAGVASLAMADAAEETAGLEPGTIRLKWPNDLVMDGDPPRKLAGVLGETAGLGGADPRAIIGVGINVGWRAQDFPPDLASTMTSLREASHRDVDGGTLLDRFLGGLAIRVSGLRSGDFPAAAWERRQITSGRLVDLVLPDERHRTVRALDVDPWSGGLVIEDGAAPGGRRTIFSGEILHARLAGPASAAEFEPRTAVGV